MYIYIIKNHEVAQVQVSRYLLRAYLPTYLVQGACQMARIILFIE